MKIYILLLWVHRYKINELSQTPTQCDSLPSRNCNQRFNVISPGKNNNTFTFDSPVDVVRKEW